MKKKDLPKELKEALAKVSDRPSEDTPSIVLEFLTGSEEQRIENYLNQFKVNQIVNYADENLLDLELDEKLKQPTVYNDFAVQVALKVTSLVDIDTKKSKSLEFYDSNSKIKRLKAKDFTKLGDLTGVMPLEKAEVFAKFYGVEKDEDYLSLSSWEKKLFADKVMSREYTEAEKN